MIATALRKKNKQAMDKCIKQKYLLVYHLQPKLTYVYSAQYTMNVDS